MKKRFLLFLCVSLLVCLAVGFSGSAFADDRVPINGTTFPDEYFRAYVSEVCDANSDGYLNADEIAAVDRLWLSANANSIIYYGLTQEQVDYIQSHWQNNIASLKGIEYFGNLRYLYAFMMPKLRGTVDLRQNTELRTVDMHNIEFPNGTSHVNESSVSEVKVSGLKKLRELRLTNHFALHSLDVSGCTALEDLHATGTSIDALDVSGNQSLRTLACAYTYIGSLDVSQNEALEVLDAYNIKVPFALTLGNLENLRILSAQNSPIEMLNISGCPILLAQLKDEYYHDDGDSHRYESVSGSDGYCLRYSKDTRLITGDTVPVSAMFFPDEYFRAYISEVCDADGDGLLSPDEIAAVDRLWLSANANSIIYYGLTQEQVDYIQSHWQNNIASLKGIEYFGNLRYLYAFMMPKLRGTVDLRQNTELRTVDMHNIEFPNGTSHVNESSVSEVKVSGLKKLRELRLTNHFALHSLDVIGCTALEDLHATGTSIEALDVSGNQSLRTLACAYTYIGSLDVSQNEALEVLDAYNIKAPFALTLGNLENLRILSAQNSPIELLNISGCPILLAQLKDEYYHDDGDSHRYESVSGSDGYCLRYSKDTELITGDTVPVSAMFFPDEAFRAYVGEVCDADGDGFLSPDEIDAVRSINLSEDERWKNNVASLDGIRYFGNLRSLQADALPNISGDLDFSNNKELRSIKMSNIVFIDGKGQDIGAVLSSVTLGNLPKLEEAVFTNHRLREIDVSGCPALYKLDVAGTNLRELDVSSLKLLKVLQCNYTYISDLDVSHNTQLAALNCFSIKVPFSLTLGNLPDMRALAAQYSHMEKLDISGCPILLGLLKEEYYTDRGDFHSYESAPGNDGTRVFYDKHVLLQTEANQVFSTLTLPASLREIGEEAFAGTAADVVVLPEGCQSVASRAFANCPKVQIVYAPADTVIDEHAFDGCGHVFVSRAA